MAELLGVELARPGAWDLAVGGKTPFTPEMLRDAADFFAATGAQPVPVGLGHTDDRFDGDPAFGLVSNIRYAEDEPGYDPGPVLLGDVTDLPEWLHAAAPTRWPNRSVEGLADFEYEGRTYRLALTRLAFLGSTPPAMRNLRSLRHVQEALAAAQRIAASAPIAAAAVSDKSWSQFTAADYSPEQWRRACLIDTGNGPADAKARYKLPVREPSGVINRNACHAAAAVLAGGRGGVQASAEQKRAAATRLASIYRNDLNEEPPASLAASATAPQTPAPAAEAPQEKGAGMTLAKIREVIAGLPDDASEEDIAKALAAAGVSTPEPAQPADPPQPAPSNPPAPPAPQPAGDPQPQVDPAQQTLDQKLAAAAAKGGVITLDSSQAAQLQETQRRFTALEARLDQRERDEAIGDAIKAGKIAPARRKHYEQYWEGDREGAKMLLASLHPGLVPVDSIGYSGDGSEEAMWRAEFGPLFPPEISANGKGR